MPLSTADLLQITNLITSQLAAARIKISELPAAGAISSSAIFPMVDAGSTQSATLARLLSEGVTTVTVGQSLRAMASADLIDNALFFTEGVLAVNDGGGGLWVYDSASVADDNIGTVISPDDGVGRFLRVYDGPINVKWFGAKGDNANDDTSACAAATLFLDSLGGGACYFPFGTYLVDTILYYDNITFIPECKGTTIKKRGNGGGTSDPIFDSSDNGASSQTNVQWLSGFVLDGNKAAQGATASRIGIMLQGTTNVLIDGIEIKDCNLDALMLYGSGATRIVPCDNVVIRNFKFTGGNRTNMAVITAQNITVEDGVMSGAGGASPNTNLDIERDSAAMTLKNITFRRVDFKDAVGNGVYLVPNRSDILDANIVFDDCGFYDNGAKGLQVTTGGFRLGPVILNNCRSSGNATGGVDINETFNFRIQGGEYLETAGTGVNIANDNEFWSISGGTICQGGTATKDDLDFADGDSSNLDGFVGSDVQFRGDRFLAAGTRTRWAPRVSIFTVTKVANGTMGCTDADGCFVTNDGTGWVQGINGDNPQLVPLFRLPENALIFKGSVYAVTPVTGVTTATAQLGRLGAGTIYSATLYDLMAAAGDTNFLDFTTTVARGTKAADFMRQNLTYTGGLGVDVVVGSKWTWEIFWGTAT